MRDIAPLKSIIMNLVSTDKTEVPAEKKKWDYLVFVPLSLILAPRFEAHKLPNLAITDKKKTTLFCLSIWSGTSA